MGAIGAYGWSMIYAHSYPVLVNHISFQCSELCLQNSVGYAWIAIEHPSKSLSIYLPIHAGNVLQMFVLEIQSQTEVRVRKPKNPKWPPGGQMGKWHSWKLIGSFPYTYVMCHWSLNLIFKAKLKLESGNQRIQDDNQAAMLRVIDIAENQ